MSTIRLTVRDIPADLHATIADIAKANRRTINATILIALEGFVARAKQHVAKPARKGRK